MESVASINNIYALFGVIFVAFTYPVLQFFKNDGVKVRIGVAAVIAGVLIFLIMRATYVVDLNRVNEKTQQAANATNVFDSTAVAFEKAKNKILQEQIELLTIQLQAERSKTAVNSTRVNHLMNSIDSARSREREVANVLRTALINSAKKNISWIFAEPNARRRYYRYLDEKGNGYQAAIATQAHNPAAQRVIEKFGQTATEAFIVELHQRIRP